MNSNENGEERGSVDRGRLPLETRRVLIQLLQGPMIDSRRHGILWDILLREEVTVRERMGDLFLDVVIDREAGVAFTRQAELEGIDAPRLLRRMNLTFIDSVLILSLRRRLLDASERGDRAAVDGPELCEHLSVYEASANTDHAGFNKRVRSSMEKMKKYGILMAMASGEDRYEISPALSLLFPPEEIKELAARYESIAGGAAIVGDEESEKGEEDDS